MCFGIGLLMSALSCLAGGVLTLALRAGQLDQRVAGGAVSYLPYIDDIVNRNARLERTTRHLLGRGTWSAQAPPVLLNLIPDGYYRDR